MADLRPGPERIKHAARVAIAGMLIIAVEMTLRYEIMYPAMTTLLIVAESRGFSSVARFFFLLLGATLGCAAAIALMALFIQQPFFLLPIMWGFIILVIYYMGSSRYRAAFFVAGYSFIVAVYMSFFDKSHAEALSIQVYKSIITGIACGSLVMLFVWPARPEEALAERLRNGIARSRAVAARLLEAVRGGKPFDSHSFVAEHYRARVTAMMSQLDQVETDLSLGPSIRARILAMIAFDARSAAELATIADRVSRGAGEGAGELESALVAIDERLAAADVDFMRFVTRPDFATQLGRNLRESLPRIFRMPLWPPNLAQAKHAIKCSSVIMICALFCITMNWAHGIGCVETVMLVVQVTLGGTLLIGVLRLFGDAVGFAVAIGLVIWVVPVVTTLPGLLAAIGPLLFCVGYAMHGSARVCVPALQMMIVVDFALLQVPRPSMNLYPAMNFALAVAMGILVTFAVYRLVWPARAVAALPRALEAMRAAVAVATRFAASATLTPRRLAAAHLRVADQASLYLAAHGQAQLEEEHPVAQREEELRQFEATERSCAESLAQLSASIRVQAAPQGALPRPGE